MKWVRLLIIHGAIISSINMTITGISRDNSQPQIPLTKKRIPQREIVATLKTLQLVLWDPVESECFSWGLWDLTWLEVFTQKQQVSFKMAQVPRCSGIRRSISCLFWCTTSAKLCWLFRAVLRNLIPRNLILGVFIRMALICSPG